MKKWIWQTAAVLLIAAAAGAGSYVAVKAVLGGFLLSADSAVQRKVDELVGELDGALRDISGFRDSLGAAKEGLSDLGAELDRSAEAANAVGERLESSLERERELEKALSGAEGALGVLAEGIGKGESAFLRLGEYIDRHPGDGEE